MSKGLWPNFIIVGAARSGTTSLYEYLNCFSQVYMSPLKEPHFFLSEMGPNSTHLEYARNEEEYHKLFEGVKEEIAIGEASPSYLWDPLACERIKEQIPQCRIIIILRDPIERAYSQFLFDLKYGYENNLDFHSAVKQDYYRERKGWGTSHMYVELGMYSEQVKRYLAHFEGDKVKIMIFEEFIKDTKDHIKGLSEFLGVRYDVGDELLSKIHNASDLGSFKLPRSNRVTWQMNRVICSLNKKYKWFDELSHKLPPALSENLLIKKASKPLMSEDAYEFLHDKLSEDARQLQALLGRALPWNCINGLRV
jgi:Sulfotransferase domain